MSRIALLEVVASSRGGGAVHVRDLALGLDAERFEVTVAMPNDGGHVGASSFAGSHVRFVELPIASRISHRALAQLRRLASESDILHVHGARAALFGRLAAASLGSRRPQVVYTIHGFAAPHYGWMRRSALLGAERLLKPWTDQVIAVSEAERGDWVSATPYASQEVAVIRNGIMITPDEAPRPDRAMVRAALGVSPEEALLIMACRLYRPRDIPTLLDAFRQLHISRPCRLLIVGDGPYRAAIEAEIVALNLQGRVQLLGFRADVRGLMQASDLFVLSTALWEGLPLTVLEAMDAALPVVASRVGGISEAVIDGKTGLLAPPRDAIALRQALESLLGDLQRARAMGLEGRQRVRDHFDRARMVAETACLYLGLMERKRVHLRISANFT